jgi:hypothetical protein
MNNLPNYIGLISMPGSVGDRVSDVSPVSPLIGGVTTRSVVSGSISSCL